MKVPKIIYPDDLNANPDGYDDYEEVKVVQDSDSHNYVIPRVLYEKFSELDEKLHSVEEDDEEYDAIMRDFEDTFNEYRTGGDINVQLYAIVGYQFKPDF